MTQHLGIVCTLPPTPSGPADFVTLLLPELAKVADVTCYVADPDNVREDLQRLVRVRPIDERHQHRGGVLNYHYANNIYQKEVVDAGLIGPPGLLTVHDASQRHLLEFRTLFIGDDWGRWARAYRAAHGDAGLELARMRMWSDAPRIERFLFDMLRPSLLRHRGVIVHNGAAESLVRMRCPGLPVWREPLIVTPPAQTTLSRSELGLREGAFILAHFGYVIPTKRPELLVDVLKLLRERGVDADLLFGGMAEDDALPRLQSKIAESGLGDHITITGYLPKERMDALMQRVDVIASVRFPHVGESSGTVADALILGRAVILQDVGSWAEFPDDVVYRVSSQGDEATDIADACIALMDPELRAGYEARAKVFARRALDPGPYVRMLLEISRQAEHWSGPLPRQLLRGRSAAVAERRRDTLGSAATVPTELEPAPLNGRLLAVGATAEVVGDVRDVYGYEVTEHRTAPSGQLPYRTGTFDAVLWYEPGTDEHVLRECHRVLGGDGVLMLPHAQLTAALEVELQRAGFDATPRRIAALMGEEPQSRSTTLAARKVCVPLQAVAS